MEENKEKDINEINNKYFTNDFSKEIWETNYKLKTEKTIEETWSRVAKAVASVEKTEKLQNEWEQKFYKALENFKLIPGGRILANAGGPNKATSLINCFTSPKPESDVDSLESILWILNRQALTLKSEGGWGCNFSFIRPRGSYIKGIGVRSPGSVKYMEIFDKSSEIITEGPGSYELAFEDYHAEEKTKIRKGAMMMILDIWHPDIEEFITAKRKPNHLTKANLSVNVSNSFMDKLLEIQKLQKEGAPQEQIDALDIWELIFPDTEHEAYKAKWFGNIQNWVDAGYPVKCYRKVKVTELWDKIMKSTYDFADPGVLFLDIANQDHCANYLEKLHIDATNPCVLEGTYVDTPNGPRKVETIGVGENISTLHPNGYEPVNDIQVTENVPVFKVTFSDGGVLNATASHQFHVLKRNTKFLEFKRLDELQPGDNIQVCPNLDVSNKLDTESLDFKRGLFAGILVGDGSYTEKSPIIKICSSTDDVEFNNNIKSLLFELFSVEAGQDDKAYTSKSVSITIPGTQKERILNDLGLEELFAYEKRIPDWIFGNYNAACGFFNGLLATDGNINLKTNHPQIRLKTTSAELATGLRRLLLFLGMHSKIYHIPVETIKSGTIAGRTIQAKHDQYEIHLSGFNAFNAAKILYDNINIAKRDRVRSIIYTTNVSHGCTSHATIVSIEPNGVGRVYDLHCLESDTWITDGYVQRGCGEQCMPPGFCCNLSSINLTQFVEYDPTTHMTLFNYEAFKDIVHIGVRFLDNVLEIANTPLNDYETMIKRYRRIGLGVTGIGSTLAMLGMDYANASTEVFLHNIMSVFNSEAIKCSIALGKEKGSFEGFDKDKHLKNLKATFPYVFAEEWQEIENMESFRNSSLFSIQPTGNTGCLANCISGGIEPVFEKTYIRTVTVPVMPDNIKDKVPRYWEGDFTPNEYFKPVSQWGITFLTYTDPETNIVYKIFQDRGLCKEIVCEDYSIYWLKRLQQEHSCVFDMDYRCAMDLSCDEHLKILATMAKHIDSSQSKTINVASDYPYEDFKNIYINAYLTKRIKGVTTYRDKTKAAVLNTKSQSECECCKKIAKTTAPKRPKTLPCKVHLMTIKGIAYYAIVSMLGEDPYEVFIGQNKEDIKNEDGEYVGSKLLFFQKLNGCEGELTRLTRGKYTFKSKDGKIEVPIIRTEESEDTALITAFSRILSWGLRHGGDIKFAVDQLEKTEGSFSSATKVFSRVLKKYIKATDQVCGCDDKKTVCPKCGAALVFTEGCKHCAQCGWSACG